MEQITLKMIHVHLSGILANNYDKLRELAEKTENVSL